MGIAITQKTKIYGDKLNVLELIKALESEHFKDNAPVCIQTQHYQGDLYAVYKADKDNDNLTLLANNVNIFNHTLYENFEVMGALELVAERVYKFQEKMTRSELIVILKEISPKTSVYCQTVADLETGILYGLTGVYRCSTSCPAVHLDCSYEEFSFMPN